MTRQRLHSQILSDCILLLSYLEWPSSAAGIQRSKWLPGILEPPGPGKPRIEGGSFKDNFFWTRSQTWINSCKWSCTRGGGGFAFALGRSAETNLTIGNPPWWRPHTDPLPVCLRGVGGQWLEMHPAWGRWQGLQGALGARPEERKGTENLFFASPPY